MSTTKLLVVGAVVLLVVAGIILRNILKKKPSDVTAADRAIEDGAYNLKVNTKLDDRKAAVRLILALGNVGPYKMQEFTPYLLAGAMRNVSTKTQILAMELGFGGLDAQQHDNHHDEKMILALAEDDNFLRLFIEYVNYVNGYLDFYYMTNSIPEEYRIPITKMITQQFLSFAMSLAPEQPTVVIPNQR